MPKKKNQVIKKQSNSSEENYVELKKSKNEDQDDSSDVSEEIDDSTKSTDARDGENESSEGESTENDEEDLGTDDPSSESSEQVERKPAKRSKRVGKKTVPKKAPKSIQKTPVEPPQPKDESASNNHLPVEAMMKLLDIQATDKISVDEKKVQEEWSDSRKAKTNTSSTIVKITENDGRSFKAAKQSNNNNPSPDTHNTTFKEVYGQLEHILKLLVDAYQKLGKLKKRYAKVTMLRSVMTQLTLIADFPEELFYQYRHYVNSVSERNNSIQIDMKKYINAANIAMRLYREINKTLTNGKTIFPFSERGLFLQKAGEVETLFEKVRSLSESFLKSKPTNEKPPTQ